jgi:hypothetical protein
VDESHGNIGFRIRLRYKGAKAEVPLASDQPFREMQQPKKKSV